MLRDLRDKTPWATALLVAALHVPSHAAEPSIALYCARGAPDYPDAEMKLSTRGSHVVNVIFVGFRPSRVRADWSLRDCLNTAAKYDGSRDIVASLWYRDRERRSPHELLRPYGASAGLVYRASGKTVVLQKPETKP